MYNYYYPSPLAPKIINCTFYNNSSTTQGGAIYNSSAKPLILNCSFDMNSSHIGGAIQNESDSDPTITNCVLWGNTATLAGSQMHSSFDSLPDITYCDIDQDGFTFGNNIRQVPNWVGSGDFHLLSPSPCIDTGTNDSADLPEEDYEGNPRIYDGDGNMTPTVDMGVDEYLGGGLLPSVPSNPNPSDAASDISVTANLDWDNSTGADSYDVYFGTSSPPPLVENVASSAYSLTTLEEGMKYYWKIVARNAFGETAGSEWSFTTESAGILPDYYVFDGHDFDGDGDSDVSVWRPANGRWYILGVGGFIWGTTGDIPVNGDYNGDGTTDIAVWRPSNGRWYIQGIAGYIWGTTGDIPAVK
jgi:predicted outer membrane repeat protein